MTHIPNKHSSIHDAWRSFDSAFDADAMLTVRPFMQSLPIHAQAHNLGAETLVGQVRRMLLHAENEVFTARRRKNKPKQCRIERIAYVHPNLDGGYHAHIWLKLPANLSVCALDELMADAWYNATVSVASRNFQRDSAVDALSRRNPYSRAPATLSNHHYDYQPVSSSGWAGYGDRHGDASLGFNERMSFVRIQRR